MEEQQQQQQQQQLQQHHQSIPVSIDNPLPNQPYDIQQRRPSNSGVTPGYIHETQNGNHKQVPSQLQQQQQQPPIPAIYTQNRIQHPQPQQLNHLQLSNIAVAQSLQHQIQHQQHFNHSLGADKPIPYQHAQNQQQKQSQLCNDQFPTIPQQPERLTDAPLQNILPPSLHPPQNNVGQQSQLNSLNPSPVSQPSIINPSTYPMCHQQQQVLLQPVLSYQPQQQMLHSQGIYAQQPVQMLQPSILYTNATLVSSCQAVIAPSSQEIASLEFPTNVAPTPGSPSEVVKRGRFRVTKGGKGLKNTTENASSNESNSRHESAEIAALSSGPADQNTAAGLGSFPPVQVDASVKKKGRFVVKTAPATSNKTAKSKSIAPGDIPNDEVLTLNCIANGTHSMKGQTADEEGNKTDVCVKVSGAGDENNSVNLANTLMVHENTVNKPVDLTSVSTKKKGRFVVKTGGNPVISLPTPSAQEAISVDGSISKNSIPSVVSTVTDSFQAAEASLNASSATNPNIATSSFHLQQNVLASQVAKPLTANVSVPISNIHPAQTIGALDVNGHFVLVSAPVMAPNPNVPQSTQSLPHHSTSNIMQSGISANLGYQPQQSSLIHTPSLSQEELKQKKAASISKAPRLVENPAPNKPQTAGRLFGTVGVGKVLHYLESVRLEVVEADRSLASLQSENRILKDKNKELEAKNAKLERQLAEERANNRKLHQRLLAGQNPPNPFPNNQVNKNSAVGAESSISVISNGSTIVNKKIDDAAQRNQLRNSVEPTAPPSDSLSAADNTDESQNSVEETSPKRSRHLGQEHSQSLDMSPKGNAQSRAINPIDPSANCMAHQLKQQSSIPPPLSLDVTEKMPSHDRDVTSVNTEIACCAVGASNVVSAQHSLDEFDPLSSITNGTVFVPVVLPPPQVNEKDSMNFDPLGTPKRSGSKLLLDTSNLASYSEFNVSQQVSAYPAQGHKDVSNSAMSTSVPVQPGRAPAAPVIMQPLVHNPSPKDPFDEIALRHGGNQT